MARIFLRYPTECVNDAGRMVIRYAPHEIAEFRFDGGQWVSATDIARPGNYEIRCNKCQSNDWTENGRFINEYECGCCGAFITVEPKNEWRN
ncbi:hypothetical protein FX356_00650 [Salmonella enterica]|nr:hypothetical protein [Salmonella enterica]ECI4024438.1 hypothetical protein [Salmonella enterica subsp. houtenae]ECJ2263894.1 hypothetical protein [Salmonella enterica subsp. salamae]EDS4117059.1 hypothetical protein [Salmonella enterica subsp. enterica serovar Braenderup]EDT6916663.1 hypothetical protein [Salmonella enterica subsp. enterica serovar Lexington]EDW9603562.1 hypothetical protein [Salmonella enterica subsp. houtenae serovar 50:z4,z23:-]